MIISNSSISTLLLDKLYDFSSKWWVVKAARISTNIINIWLTNTQKRFFFSSF